MTVLKFILGVLIAVGIFLVIGAAGNDCDGKCMENALTLSQIALYGLGGMCATAMGALLIMKG